MRDATLVQYLREGRECVVEEIIFCDANARESIKPLLANIPDLVIRWICFANDPEAANWNVTHRTNKGDPEGHLKINKYWCLRYTYPADAEIRSIYRLPPFSAHSLKPNETVFTFLFTSPVWFLGECSGEGYYASAATQSYGRTPAAMRETDPPLHSHFIVSVRGEAYMVREIRSPMYTWAGEELSALLGGYFGKLVVNRGHIVSVGSYNAPASVMPMPRKDRFPFNDAPRNPGAIRPDLTNAGDLIRKYLVSYKDESLSYILRAAEFYRVGLESMNDRPELALAMFVSSLEALTPMREYAEEELYDCQLLADLNRIEESVGKGKQIVKRLRSRMYQVKRKVAALVDQYIPDSYFREIEAPNASLVVKTRQELISRVRSVYDLRSKFLHTGDRSGLWFIEMDHGGSEVGTGAPHLDDRKLVKLLVNGMTMIGIERVVSTVLRSVIREWVHA
jgi:hypothetical protein